MSNIQKFDSSLAAQYKQASQLLAESANKIKVSEANMEIARGCVSDIKSFLKNVAESRLAYTRILDDAKKKVMSLEKDATADASQALDRLERDIKQLLLEQEQERQRKEREAEQAAQRIQDNRLTMIDSLRKACQSVTPETLNATLSKLNSFKPKDFTLYGVDAQEGEAWFISTRDEWKELIQEAALDQNAKAAAEAAASEQANKARFDTAIHAQAQIQDAGQKAKGVQFKEVYEAESSDVYSALLAHYISTGGDLSKLDFLLRWAEKNRFKPEGIKVTQVPILRG